MLLTMKQEAKRQGFIMPAPERISKVRLKVYVCVKDCTCNITLYSLIYFVNILGEVFNGKD